jgi:AcrR family transcriptional regulator
VLYTDRVTKGEETRAAILDEAIDIASTKGLGGLTIGTLAAATGMSKSGLYAHFKSKEQLQQQTLDRASERFVDVVVRPSLSAARGEKRVRALLENWLRWADDALSGGCLFIGAAAELDDQPGALRDHLVRIEQDWLDLIAHVAATAVAEGYFAAGTDVEQFAYDVHGVTLAYHHSSRLMHDPRAAERAERALESLIESVRA